MKKVKTIEEINQKIKDGDAVVVTAGEMTRIVQENGAGEAAKEVDVVTTGTFGAMCSSGAFFNFGHSDPPIKMSRTYLNGVEAYSGLAAVDAYHWGHPTPPQPRYRFGLWWCSFTGRSCAWKGSGTSGRGLRD